MSKKLKRLGDWLSYNLHFKDLGFLIVSTIIIEVFVVESKPKPLKHYPEVDQQNQTLTSFRSKYFPSLLWVLLEWNKYMQWSKIEKQGHWNNGSRENLIAICWRCWILWIFYISRKDTKIDFLNYAKPKKSFPTRLFQLAKELCAN